MTIRSSIQATLTVLSMGAAACSGGTSGGASGEGGAPDDGAASADGGSTSNDGSEAVDGPDATDGGAAPGDAQATGDSNLGDSAGGGGGSCTADGGGCGAGQVCGFKTADGCSATGTCFQAMTGAECLVYAPGCTCSGGGVNLACNGYPSGYAAQPVLHSGACGTDGGI